MKVRYLAQEYMKNGVGQARVSRYCHLSTNYSDNIRIIHKIAGRKNEILISSDKRCKEESFSDKIL